VRPGREQDALEWLKQSQVEGTDGLNEIYAGDDNDTFKAKYAQRHEVAKVELTIEEILGLAVEDIKAKHVASTEVIKEQVELELGQVKDIFYLAPDKVFEKGFDPLEDGFRATPNADWNANFEVFDQMDRSSVYRSDCRSRGKIRSIDWITDQLGGSQWAI